MKKILVLGAGLGGISMAYEIHALAVTDHSSEASDVEISEALCNV